MLSYKQQLKKRKKQKEQAFTLVEVMVSVAIFSMIMVAGMGALMSTLSVYHYAKSEKKAADAVSSVLENMTRELRLGYQYYVGADFDNPPSAHVADGTTGVLNGDGSLIGFQASENRGYLVYYLKDGELFKKLFKPNGDVLLGKLTRRSQVIITEARATVMHTDPNDGLQPLVWIQLKIVSPNNQNKFRIIQTLVSQRILDFAD